MSYNLEFLLAGEWKFYQNFPNLEKLLEALDEEANQHDYRVTECRVVYDTTI